MRLGPSLAGFIAIALPAPALWAQTPSVRATYQVKQLAAGAVYLDGGSNDGLKEGMHLKVSRLTPGEAQMSRKEIGDLTVVGVASISAVCEAKESALPIEVGDNAELSYEDAQAIQILRSSKTIRHTAQTVSFTEGDPLDEELREYVPRPPSPEVNRVRGRISFEQSAILDHTSGMRTMQEGIVLRLDMTRIAGSYWNFTGYWRGRLSNQTGALPTQTLSDLLNRTYQIGAYYNNPNSRYVAGFGRYLLPWAPSLSTLDGGYFGRRLSKEVTTGIFAGSTPNPTAWNYDPNRQLAGAFVAFEHGSYETVRYTSTAGAAVTRSHWHPERQFLFFENSLAVGSKISIYHDLEVDRLAPSLTSDGRTPVRLARSFATLRVQPVKRLSLDVSHNYFRDVPTFDTRLLGTGLLDQFLFQGLSGGFRIVAVRDITLYGSVGRSKRDQDTQASLNYMSGVVLPRLPGLPSLPGLPHLPSLTLPHLPGLPRMALPHIAGPPSFTLPHIPGPPSLTLHLGRLGTLTLPRLPGLPALTLPSLPGLPALTLPSVPGPPALRLPSLPGIPGPPALPSLGFRTDVRYSKFTSSFGRGSYASVTLSRQITEKVRFDIQGGVQSLASPFTTQTRTKYGTATLDYLIGNHYILGAGWTVYHGGTQNYDQTFVNLGYRF